MLRTIAKTCSLGLLIYLSLMLSVVLGSDEELWTTMEEDIDVYYIARTPAAIPLADKAVTERIHDFIRLTDENNNEIEIKVTDTYGKTRIDSTGNKKEHHGWDLAAPAGSLIRWMYGKGETKVKSIAYAPWSGQNDQANYGYQVSVTTRKDETEYVLRFCHLMGYEPQHRTVGSIVAQGTGFAKVGTSGRMPNAVNPHLHLEVFKKAESQFIRIDPLDFFRPLADGGPQAPTNLRVMQSKTKPNPLRTSLISSHLKRK